MDSVEYIQRSGKFVVLGQLDWVFVHGLFVSWVRIQVRVVWIEWKTTRSPTTTDGRGRRRKWFVSHPWIRLAPGSDRLSEISRKPGVWGWRPLDLINNGDLVFTYIVCLFVCFLVYRQIYYHEYVCVSTWRSSGTYPSVSKDNLYSRIRRKQSKGYRPYTIPTKSTHKGKW